MRSPSTGFTLIELLVVILLISILSVSVLPKLFSVESQTLQGQRDQLLALLHQLQLQSMQDTANLDVSCPTLVVSSALAGFASSNTCTAAASLVADSSDPQQIIWQTGALVSSTAGMPVLVRFDSWGRPSGSCAAGCSFSLSQHNVEYRICINSSGFISLC